MAKPVINMTQTGGLFGNRLKETITNVNNANATGGHPKAYGEYQYVYPDKSNCLARIDYKASGETTFTATKPSAMTSQGASPLAPTAVALPPMSLMTED